MPFDWTQGAAPPPVNIKQAQSTTAPGFYTDYLKSLGSAGQAALGAEAPQYVGAQSLQTSAFDEAKNRMFGGQQYLDAASRFGQAAGASAAEQLGGYTYTDPLTGDTSTIGGNYGPTGAPDYFGKSGEFADLSGATTAQQLAGYKRIDPVTGQEVSVGGGYMNPYVKDVVSEIGRLGRRQLQESLPGVIGQATGLGGFGSKRALEAAGIAGRESLANILGQQTGALSAGYDAAQKAAQADLARYLQGAATYGQLGQAGYQTAAGLAQSDLNRYLQGAQAMGGLGQIASGTNIAELQNLASLGAQQQAIAQGEENFPLQTAQAVSGLLRGYTMPTDVSSTYEGPLAGLQYSPSGLQMLGTVAGLFSPTGQMGTGKSAFQSIVEAGSGAVDTIKNSDWFKSLFGNG